MQSPSDPTYADNPLLQEWSGPFNVPPLDRIAPEHFPPAFAFAMSQHLLELGEIAGCQDASDFRNTVEALERAGGLLDRVSRVFTNFTRANSTPELQEIERSLAPVLAKHRLAVGSDPVLFGRLDDVLRNADGLSLDPERRRVLELRHRAFVRGGARFSVEGRARLSELVQRLAELGTLFAQNVSRSEREWRLYLYDEEDLAGLPDWYLDSAKAKARSDGEPGYAVTLQRSSVVPFLQFAEDRSLRRTAFLAWTGRGEGPGDTDNVAIAAEMLRLRRELASLHGQPDFASFEMQESMAGTPAHARAFLMRVWHAALVKAEQERAQLLHASHPAGLPEIEPWDWRFWATRVLMETHHVDEGEIKQYLRLDRLIEAAFETAGRLFGVRFSERTDIPVYHPDVRAWEVTADDGKHLALFLGDYFARTGKRDGAWSSSYRAQNRLDGDTRPIVVNVLNLAAPGPGRPALLSLDEARTLFHEFGHALHAMLSDVTFPSIAGPAVPLDFVELPSQLFEHWLLRREVLERFAAHVGTGAPMPSDLMARILASKNANQGFENVEFIASALVDLELHTGQAADLDPLAVERETLERVGMPSGIAMRHRVPHFTHVFSGDGYAAGYYSYLWSEMLDADAFRAFEEAGDVFDPAVAGRLLRFIYSAGGTRTPEDAYRAFRGRDPDPEALFLKRGLIDPPAG